MSENETIQVPIPAGDDNPEVKFLENQKQSRSDEPATPTGMRASNTLETLKPREVTGFDTPSGGSISLEEVRAPEAAFQSGQQVVRKTDNPSSEEPQKWTKAFHGAGNMLPVNFPASTGLDGKPLELPYQGETGLELPKPKETVYGPHKPEFAKQWKSANDAPKTYFVVPGIHERVTKLEEQVDSLLDRIAKHNQRSSHKI